MSTTRFPVEWGHMMMFARAVGDDHEMYQLPTAEATMSTGPSPVCAPPTFVVSCAHFDEEWPLRPRPGQPWLGSGRTPTGVSAENDQARGLLHAEQRFDYHIPIRPGDVLTVTETTGATWTKAGRRGGKLTFTQTVQEFRNQHSELVVTATATAVVTERTAP